MGPSARLVSVVVALPVVLAGCGSASAPSPPTGVDELVIPSPSLDPADFVDEIDNPWLPLVAGTTWRYRATTAGQEASVTVTVLDDTRKVAAVTATVVRTAVVDERGRPSESDAWFAQDDDGNVWSLGVDGAWEAGVDGGAAGLAMPAQPRVGDGYRTEYRPGVAERRALVVGLDGSAAVPYGDLTGLLVTEASSVLAPDEVAVRQYARGIGLVRELESPEGDELALVAFEAP